MPSTLPAPESDDAPAWQARARERSLTSARQRVDDQQARLVQAAQEMIGEGTDFTVPGLVQRAGMSTKTFYRHFESRDDLLLAVLEEELSVGAAAVARAIARHAEPIARFRACVTAYVSLPAGYRDNAVRRARVLESRRLEAIHPERSMEAGAPLRATVRAVIADLAAAGTGTIDDVDLTASSVIHLLDGHLTDAALSQAPAVYERLAAHAWTMCTGMLRLPE